MKRLLTFIIFACGFATSLWAISTDSEGNYLIGSLQDWKDFAAIVNGSTNASANAKMTADIDLGTEITMIGTESNPYQGTFDGQGHMLTVNWSTTENAIAPFRYVCGATIQKLHVEGSITTTQRCSTSIVAYSRGSITTTISECWSSASITGYDTMGGMLAQAQETSTVNITDCLFSGTINPTHSGEGCSAGFASQAVKNDSNIPTINITRGLFMGSYTGSNNRCYTFVRMDYPQYFGNHNITDCYYKNSYGTSQGTQATTEELGDGTTTTALNAGRMGDDAPWVQNPLTNQPMLKVFALKQDNEGCYLIGSARELKDFATLVNGGTVNVNAKLTSDIDLAGDEDNQWTPIGTSTNKYNGTFDGQGFTIKNLYFVQQIENVALFGFTNTSTYIKNVHVVGTIDITNHNGGNTAGKNVRAAGIVANARGGIILNCSYAGSATSYSHTGGIVGYANSNVRVVNCYNEATVIAPSNALQELGGIIGKIDSGSAINCYNVGDVKNTASGSVIIYPIASNGSNCYYRSNCCQASSGGSWSNGSNGGCGTAMSEDDMKAETFVATLNANVEALRTTYPDISKWVLNSNGYPVHANGKLTYTVPASDLGTFSSSFRMALPDGLEAYYCKNYDASAGTISVVPIDGVVPAETGVLLRGTAGKTYTLTISDETAAAVTDNALVAVTTQTDITQTDGLYTNFGLNGGVFKKVNTNGGTVKANRAYLHILTSELNSLSREISLVWDGESTGIVSIKNEQSTTNNSVYDLQGRKIIKGQIPKGLYIINGHKYVIK